MGLAGRKVKQRIGADPRNLTWSDDSSKFGAKYLQSLGWTSGTGLGTSGDGRISNLKIHQKLDLMGIGANRGGPGGDDAGWRGGREFEGLLARLNRAQNEDTQEIPIEDQNKTEAHHIETVQRTEDATKSTHELTVDNGQTALADTAPKDKKKRKRVAEEEEPIDKKEAKRRRKEEKKEKKEEKERRKAEKAAKKLKKLQGTEGREAAVKATVVDEIVAKSSETAVKSVPYRAHRARHLASKRLAAASATSMNEILGIASSASGQSTPSSIPFPSRGTSPPSNVGGDAKVQATDAPPMNRSGQADDVDAPPRSTAGLGFGGGLGAQEDALAVTKVARDNGSDLLRKSGKSVAEYFAEKMRLKGLLKGVPAPEVAPPSE